MAFSYNKNASRKQQRDMQKLFSIIASGRKGTGMDESPTSICEAENAKIKAYWNNARPKQPMNYQQVSANNLTELNAKRASANVLTAYNLEPAEIVHKTVGEAQRNYQRMMSDCD